MSAFQSSYSAEETNIPKAATVATQPSEASPLEPLDAASVAFTPGTKLREIERIVILETLKQKNFNRTHARIKSVMSR